MPPLNRRDLIASLGASATLLAGRAHAACDVWRDEVGGVPTKSYQCDVADGQVLTTTFMRLSDVMFDSAGYAPLPDPFGEYQKLVRGHRLIETPALSTFTRLFEKHSFAFEPANISVEFDLRGQDLSGIEENARASSGGRWRTLGAWDDAINYPDYPVFPLVNELRSAMKNPQPWSDRRLLRYAIPSDFLDLNGKMSAYLEIWNAAVSSEYSDLDDIAPKFGNLHMLADIDAGSVPGFVPLLFDPAFGFGDCTGWPYGGAFYVPPALYVDVAVCRNDGTRPVVIEDIFGASDSTERLRLYDPATPPQAERFGWAPVTLAPGESLLAVQRLLFGAETATVGETEIVPKRAVLGPTHLPKGVIVDGTPVAFDGRSHNAVILASFANCCSCPYLESWCPRAGEWIEHGKILTKFDTAEKAGSETRQLPELRTRFRLSEREHEETTLSGASLAVTLEDGTVHIFRHPDAARSLSIGESCELAFDLPKDIAAHAIGSAVTLSGHYEKFTQARFDACAAML